MTYRVALTSRSTNSKTGTIPVSTTTATTCPDACPFKSAGCYADGGPLAIHWRKVTNGERGYDWAGFVEAVAKLPEGQLWRHNQAGDLPGDGDHIDLFALQALVVANAGKRGFTYTHYPMTPANRAAVAASNANGFTVNLSGNNLAHADELATLGVGPVTVVLDADTTEHTLATPSGRKVVVCPATYRDDVSCATCQLCQRQRETIVGFPAHGASKRKASTVAKGN